MSVNNNVYNLMVGDLVERITRDSFARKLGVVVMIGEDERSSGDGGPMIKVCWADNYGTFWAQPGKLKLIVKAKKNV